MALELNVAMGRGLRVVEAFICLLPRSYSSSELKFLFPFLSCLSPIELIHFNSSFKVIFKSVYKIMCFITTLVCVKIIFLCSYQPSTLPFFYPSYPFTNTFLSSNAPLYLHVKYMLIYLPLYSTYDRKHTISYHLSSPHYHPFFICSLPFSHLSAYITPFYFDSLLLEYLLNIHFCVSGTARGAQGDSLPPLLPFSMHCVPARLRIIRVSK